MHQALQQTDFATEVAPRGLRTLRRMHDYLADNPGQLDRSIGVCENLATPLVDFAWNELLVRTDPAQLGLLSRNAAASLRRSLLRRLTRTGNQAAQWELRVASVARNLSNHLVTRVETDLIDYFFSSGVSNESLRFLENYAALARLWALQTECWLRFLREFLDEAAAFGRRFVGRMNPPKDVSSAADNQASIISDLAMDLSDPHHGHRTVACVLFEEMGEWFYKPRSGLQERMWFELLDWLNRRGFPRPFRILKVVSNDGHCWMEGVRSRPPATCNEAADYCFRLGALMCLAHLLRAVDFHAANVVMASDQPVVVDCETLLHPVTILPRYARAEDDSIRRTGMLQLVEDLAAARFMRPQKSDCCLNELTNGFLTLYEIFKGDRSALNHLRAWSIRVGKAAIRRIYRPTRHYNSILKRSLSPSLLGREVDRNLYLRACCQNGINPSRRADAEVAALENADIPRFLGKAIRIGVDLSEKTLQQSLAAIEAAYSKGVSVAPRN